MEKHYRFEALVNAVLPDLYRYAFWLCRNRDQAEDLVQETLFRAWRALDRLRDEDAARSWLLTILRREHARGFARQRPELVDIDGLDIAGAESQSGEELAALAEMRRAMFALEETYREPLVLQVLMGYTTAEIGEIMALSQGAVLTRLHRARRQLVAELGRRPAGAGRGAV